MLIPWYYKAGGAALAFVAIAGGFYAWGYSTATTKAEAAQTALELAQTKEVLADFENAALAMNGLAGQYVSISQDLNTQINGISGRFRNGARNNPLPDTCRPDPFRVQHFEASITATNAAIGRGAGPAVPPTPPAR